MNRNSYLKSVHVEGFINFLAKLVDGSMEFEHHYVIKHPAWLKHLGDRIEANHIFTINSLEDAFNSYFWVVNEMPARKEDADDHDDYCPDIDRNVETAKNDFVSNFKVLDSIAKELNKALSEKSEEKTFVAAIRVLEWGQVYRGSINWLISKYDQGLLVESINDAVAILKGNDTQNLLARFDHVDLRMDSGTTKIFSLASSGNSIIYDDRVGAALGLLVIKYLKMIPEDMRPKTVPNELKFMRSNRHDRNASEADYNFPARGKNPSQIHAQSNLWANWVIQSLLCHVGDQWDARKLEAALFMIGYRV